MKGIVQNKKGWAAAMLALFLLIACICLFPFTGSVTALAQSDEPCTVRSYTVDATVNTDGTINFEEEICFTMHEDKECFYRSLPLEGGRYFYIEADSPGNEDFSFSVDDNPEVDGFMDINCYGGLKAGETLTYRFRYTMEIEAPSSDGMIIDFIGAGWPISLRGVTATVHFPAPLSDYTVYSSAYGETGNHYAEATLSADQKTIVLTADELPLYRNIYGEEVAVGITLDFSFGEEIIQGGGVTKTVWVVLIVSLVAVALTVLILYLCRKKPIVTPVVNLKPPKNMDPLRMGKFIDGSVDNEDVTSMIFYFASKGYLKVSLDEDEPVLYKEVAELPKNAPVYQKTLFDGLFKQGDRTELRDLKEKYYTSIDAAKSQLSVKDIPRFKPSSLLCMLLVGVLSFFVFAATAFFTGIIFVGGGYVHPVSLVMLFPVLVIVFFGYLTETRRYKWKRSVKLGVRLVSAAIALLVAVFYYFLIGSHLMTGMEKLIALLVGYTIAFLAPKALVQTEVYTDQLGHVLGFKEFIIVTEKDKIKFMLEDNPELFYDILPYAQVLGVTDEWEEKFKEITLTSPQWFVGDITVFDYWYFRRCMRHATFAMVARPQSKGSTVGRSGGGGSFGGFSGGGFGGGGGGFR